MQARPTISVIIVSYNTRAMTLDCLRTVYSEVRSLPAEVWVVDNSSTDNSVAAIAAEFPDVRLIANAKNSGFGAANNQAMRQANGQYLLLLNSDAFPKPGAFAALVDYLEKHPQVGAAGPRLLNADGSLQVSCFRFPSPLRAWLENLWISVALQHHPVAGDYLRWPHDKERMVDFVIGACLVVRREVFEKTGGFDEQFFMYAEEADWQRRIRDLGWEVAFTPAAEVTHLGGASGAGEKPRINRYFFESLDRYERKHHGFAGVIALRAAMIVGCALRGLAWSSLYLVPKRRACALARMKMHFWLVWRQLTDWRIVGLSGQSHA